MISSDLTKKIKYIELQTNILVNIHNKIFAPTLDEDDIGCEITTKDCLLLDYNIDIIKGNNLDIKFLHKLTFVEDNSFEYAEKIERIIKKIKVNDTEKKRYN